MTKKENTNVEEQDNQPEHDEELLYGWDLGEA